MNKLFNLIKKYKFLFLTFFVIFSFIALIPQQTHAFVGTGIFDYFDSALGAVEETAGPVIRAFVTVLTLYAVGWVALFISSTGVDYLLADPQNLLKLSGNPIVEAGWNFTSGLANLIIIILFVIVALSFILKWNAFEPKKAVVRLMVVALLVNFSFLFCQILVDASNILMQSFVNFAADGSGGIAKTLTAHVMKASGDQLFSIIAYLIEMTLAGLTVVAGPIVQAGVVTIMGFMFLPNTITFFIQLGISFLLSSIFFIYFTVLILRIAVVQILTIVSPLALICFVLPQTKNLGQQWLNNIIHWSMYTVPLTFFLMLATYILKEPVEMTLSSDLIGPAALLNSDGLGSFFITNFLLFIFLVMALIVSRKMVPKDAMELIGEATKQSKYFTAPISKIGKTMGHAAKKDVGERADALVARGDITPNLGNEKNSLMDNAVRLGTRPSSILRKWSKAPTAAESLAKRREELGKGFSDKTSAEDLEFAMGAISPYGKQEQLAMISKMSSKEVGKFLSKADSGQEEKVFNLVKTFGDKDTKEKVMRSSLRGDENDERRLIQVGGPQTKLEEVVANATGEKALDINTKAIENSSEIRNAIATHWKGNEFSTKAKKDNEFINVVNRKFSQIDAVAEKSNPSLHKYLNAETSPFTSTSKPSAVPDTTKQTTFSDFKGYKHTEVNDEDNGGNSGKSKDTNAKRK